MKDAKKSVRVLSTYEKLQKVTITWKFQFIISSENNSRQRMISYHKSKGLRPSFAQSLLEVFVFFSVLNFLSFQLFSLIAKKKMEYC